MLEKNPRKRISLYEVMKHEFVTKEGSAPMPKIDYATMTPRRSSLTKRDSESTNVKVRNVPEMALHIWHRVVLSYDLIH